MHAAVLHFWIQAVVTTLTKLEDSTVVYTATNGQTVAVNQCSTAKAFGSNDNVKNRMDAELEHTDAKTYLQTGPADFRECVRSSPVLTFNSLTQAVVDQAAAKIASGANLASDWSANEFCRHHARNCYMLHHQKASDGKTYSSSATVQYNLTVTYESATYEYPISMKYCPKMYQDYIKSTTPARKACFLNEPVLGTHFAVAMQAAEGLSGTIGKEARYGFATDSICNKQQHVCNAVPEYDIHIPPGCQAMVPKCRAALKHLDFMMIRPDPNEQQCNNFALKSMRGYWHDYQTADIEGSILWEADMAFNQGMCKWTQYINALSDATGCDPGSIITMAGQLGYKACGIDLWADGGEGRLSPLKIGRGYECKPNFNPNIDMVGSDGKVTRPERFDDLHVSFSSSHMEEFLFRMQGHFNPVTAQGFYWTQAWAITHAVGRVTCPITGQVSEDGSNPHSPKKTINIRPGFFTESVRDPKTKGMNNLKSSYITAMQFLKDTQCDERTAFEKEQCMKQITKGQKPSPNAGPEAGTPCRWKTSGAVRDHFPQYINGTNLNTLGGTCGMPEHFHGTITVRVPGPNQQVGSRWIDSAQDKPLKIGDNKVSDPQGKTHTDTKLRPLPYRMKTDEKYWKDYKSKILPAYKNYQTCDQRFNILIPYELSKVAAIPMPASAALTPFEQWAWDGIGRVDSFWDGCGDHLTCEQKGMENKLCGGSGVTAYTWPTKAPPSPPSPPTPPFPPVPPPPPPSPPPSPPSPPSPPLNPMIPFFCALGSNAGAAASTDGVNYCGGFGVCPCTDSPALTQGIPNTVGAVSESTIKWEGMNSMGTGHCGCFCGCFIPAPSPPPPTPPGLPFPLPPPPPGPPCVDKTDAQVSALFGEPGLGCAVLKEDCTTDGDLWTQSMTRTHCPVTCGTCNNLPKSTDFVIVQHDNSTDDETENTGNNTDDDERRRKLGERTRRRLEVGYDPTLANNIRVICWPDGHAGMDPDDPSYRPLNKTCLDEEVMKVLYGIAEPGQMEITKTGSIVIGDWRAYAVVHSNSCPATMELVGKVLGGLQDVLDDVGIFIEIEEPATCYDETDFEEMVYGEVPVVYVRINTVYDSSGFTASESKVASLTLAAKFATALRVSVTDIQIESTYVDVDNGYSETPHVANSFGAGVPQTIYEIRIPGPSEKATLLMLKTLTALLSSAEKAKEFTGLRVISTPHMAQSILEVPAPPSSPPSTSPPASALPSPPLSPTSSGDGGLSTGAIVGIAIGAVVTLIIVGGGIFYGCKKGVGTKTVPEPPAKTAPVAWG